MRSRLLTKCLVLAGPIVSGGMLMGLSCTDVGNVLGQVNPCGTILACDPAIYRLVAANIDSPGVRQNVGGSIPETLDLMYYLERACQTQIAAMAGGAKLRIPAAAVAEKTAAQFKALPYKPRRPEWKALLRMLDKMDASYKE